MSHPTSARVALNDWLRRADALLARTPSALLAGVPHLTVGATQPVAPSADQGAGGEEQAA